MAPGAPAPVVSELAVEHGVSLATAKRALVLLQEWGKVVRRDKAALVIAPLAPPPVLALVVPPLRAATTGAGVGDGGSLLCFVLRRRGATLACFSSVADPDNPAELHEVLVDAVERAGGDDLAKYELDVARPDDCEPFLTFVVSRRAKS